MANKSNIKGKNWSGNSNEVASGALFPRDGRSKKMANTYTQNEGLIDVDKSMKKSSSPIPTWRKNCQYTLTENEGRNRQKKEL